MNATEHIVETYYRLVKHCFTITDVQVEKGVNRQIDLLSFQKGSGECFHVETTVTHELSWRPSLNKLETYIEYKFFGKPKPSAKEAKNYYQNICETYKKFGIDHKSVKRVICVWDIKESKEEVEKWLRSQEENLRIQKRSLSILFFRDDVIPELLKEIGTSNYNDEVVRVLSLLEQYRKQTRQKVHRTVDRNE
ncbi:hypothetical protein GX441_12530 [bacterium]|nr:hypothetical protein [bacterium]